MKIKKLKGKTRLCSAPVQRSQAYDYVTVSLGDLMKQAAQRRRAKQTKT